MNQLDSINMESEYAEALSEAAIVGHLSFISVRLKTLIIMASPTTVEPNDLGIPDSSSAQHNNLIPHPAPSLRKRRKSKPTRFEIDPKKRSSHSIIYIFKTNVPSEVNGAVSLLNLEALNDETSPTPLPKKKKKKHPESLSVTVAKKKHKKSAISSISIPPSQLNDQLIEHPGNNIEEVGSEVLEGSTPSKTNISFEDFHIMVKGKCIDRELPDDVRIGYFNLCLHKKQFLHEGIPESMYCKLVAGMIGEIVSIANEIKNCKITTTKEEYETWDNSLKSFELLGMKVGFLRDKIHKLATIAFESEGALDIKKYADEIIKQKHAQEEIKKVAAKLKELKGIAKKFECVSGSLKQKADKCELRFKEEVDAPW